MTEDSVHISITIRVAEREMEIAEEVAPEGMEEAIQRISLKAGQGTLAMGIKEIDERITRRVPVGWRNVGTEGRWIVSSIGCLRYKRRVYLDEEGRRRKPVDEILGIERYGRNSGRVQEMGASLACMGTYRLAANQLSWLIKTPISHSAIQRMSWVTGNRIADGEEAERHRIFELGGGVESGKIKAPILYGESDGVWVHLQREKRKMSEVRVAIMSTGKQAVGKGRYRLENKHCVTAIGVNAEMWQEQILREAHLHYDLSQTKILISGGDGNRWVRHSFDRMDIHQEFVLDRFHLHRAASRALHDREEAREMVKRLRQEGLAGIDIKLRKRIDQSGGRDKEKLRDFYNYVNNNQDGLIDLAYRGYTYTTCLGAIEGNVDKLVVHRMKGRGCSWRLRGLRAMLALCRNCDELKHHAYDYLPLQKTKKHYLNSHNLEVQYAETINKSLPIFQGPDQGKPWVRSLKGYVYSR